MGCGFFQQSPGDLYYLVILFGDLTNILPVFDQIVWVANKGRPVRENATLALNQKDELVLSDSDSSLVWYTNTSLYSSAGLRLSENGNLFLHDPNDEIIWQSFDHPTNVWLLGQKLVVGQRLITGFPNTNQSFYAEFQDDGSIHAYINSNPAKLYAKVSLNTISFTTLEFVRTGEAGNKVFEFYSSTGSSLESSYISLDSDGHLRVNKFENGTTVIQQNVFTQSVGVCGYPTVCGNYGICTNGSCSYPMGKDGNGTSYFRAISSTNPNHGCAPQTHLICENLEAHKLVELPGIDYFSFIEVYTHISLDTCKQACLENCSCKAAIYHYYDDLSNGNCSLPNEIFSLMNGTVVGGHYNTNVFVKVEGSLTAQPPISAVPRISNHTSKRLIVVIFSVISIVSVATAFGIAVFRLCRKEPIDNRLNEDDSLAQLYGSPKRFSFEDLKSATGNFKERLGGGGFGTVFRGRLEDGTKVAVKRLDQQGQGRKEFLAEVNTIGSIHHINLVRLIGFCAEKSHKLLVYEHMSNGSLDEWIFHKRQNKYLDWHTRRNIILGVAKGLSYIHEECNKKIVHLDIKPKNILLDDGFNAKVSDFGLARFIDRDQSKVLTALRGTRGYLAPEWFLNRRISEKVDVYSFGVVVLEIVCGKKNLDNSQPEENECLLHQVRKKAKEDQLFEMVDKESDGMEQYREEAVKMLRMAIWCLFSDCSSRPSMSMVLKVLEGNLDVQTISNFGFLTLIPMQLPLDVKTYSSTLPLASILSGPR